MESLILNILLCIALSPIPVGLILAFIVVKGMIKPITDEYLEHRNFILIVPNILSFILVSLMMTGALGLYIKFIEFIRYERFMNLNK